MTVIKEYADILTKYMKKFGLEPIDIAYLAKSAKKNIIAVLNQTGSLEIETLEAISQIFGLRYYQFGDPNFSLPKFESLPDRTKERIIHRKEVGQPIPKTYSSLELKEKITNVLSDYHVGSIFLPSELGNKINTKFDLGLSDFKQITDRLKKDLHGIVEKTGKKNKVKGKRGRPEEYYRLVKRVAKDDR